MATKYDPTVIQTFADRLYAEAEGIVTRYAVAGFLFGAAAGASVGGAAVGGTTAALALGVCLGALGAALAAYSAYAKVFELRLRAQTALCQVQIELNSRRAS